MRKKKENISLSNNFPRSYSSTKFVKKNSPILSKEIDNIYKNINFKKDVFHSLSNNFIFNFKERDIKKFQKFKKVAIIGMGGSILGTKAIYFFLQKKIKKEFLFFDNLDEIKVKSLNNEKGKNNILFIIVSKSGNTIETLSILSIIKTNLKNSKNVILITEKNNNALHKLGKKFNLFLIEHPKYIGGRYSVLSEVGMLPAYLMGVNVKKLRKNILACFSKNKKKYLCKSTLLISKLYLNNKINTIVLLNYSTELKHFSFWFQQLMAESLGKKGKGLLPLVSTGPKDHHSLMQLYLDGPKDKVFYIISGKYNNSQNVVKNLFGPKFNFLKNKKLDKIITSQKNAFLKVLKRKKIPFREITVKKLNEEAIGELFSYFITETAMIGKVNKINPFDQNAVDEVKILTKRILS